MKFKLLIPKILHYCWFGPNPMPNKLIKNIQDWNKKCPDFKIKRWSENNFNITKHLFTLKAYNQHNWAFISDYVRLFALYKFGGIYLDTDVKILKPFNPLLKLNSFIGLESWSSIASGLSFGACPKDRNILNILKVYNKIGDSSQALNKFNDNTVKIITNYFHKLGFKYKNKEQIINNCVIFPTEYFCPQNRITGRINITNNTYSIHYYENSWTGETINKSRQFHILLGDLIKHIIGPKYYDYLYNIYLSRYKRG